MNRWPWPRWLVCSIAGYVVARWLTDGAPLPLDARTALCLLAGVAVTLLFNMLLLDDG